jgi:hypothetical protein
MISDEGEMVDVVGNESTIDYSTNHRSPKSQFFHLV